MTSQEYKEVEKAVDLLRRRKLINFMDAKRLLITAKSRLGVCKQFRDNSYKVY